MNYVTLCDGPPNNIHFAVYLLCPPRDRLARRARKELSRPGGNMTGFSLLHADLLGKRIDLLQKLAPATKTVNFLTDSTVPFQEDATSEVVAAGRALGLDVEIIDVFNQRNLEATFARIAVHGRRRGSGVAIAGEGAADAGDRVSQSKQSRSVLGRVACVPGGLGRRAI